MLRVIENPDEFRKNITNRLECCKLNPEACIPGESARQSPLRLKVRDLS